MGFSTARRLHYCLRTVFSGRHHMANLSGSRTLRIALSVLMMVTWAFVISASAQNRRYAGGITVYTNPNFTGQSASFNNDMPDLRGYALNDKISSLEIPNGES